MRAVISSARERLLVYVGVASALAFVAALVEFLFASTWAYSAYSGAVAVVSLCLLGFVARGGYGRRIGAPTNTQLQQSPPAIVEVSAAPRVKGHEDPGNAT